MISEAASAGLHEGPGFAPVPRLQIVTVEDAMRLRERAVKLPARRPSGGSRRAMEYVWNTLGIPCAYPCRA